MSDLPRQKRFTASTALMVFTLLFIFSWCVKLVGDFNQSLQTSGETKRMLQLACEINVMLMAHPQSSLDETIKGYLKVHSMPKDTVFRALRADERSRLQISSGDGSRDFVIEKAPDPIGILVFSDGSTQSYEKHPGDLPSMINENERPKDRVFQ